MLFTACSANELLHNKGTEAFHKWMESISGATIAPKSPDGGNDIDTLCLNDIHELMKDGASRNKLSPRDIRAPKGAVVTNGPIETDVSNLETETIATVIPLSPESLDSTCTRTHAHPMHVISTAIPPDLLDTWPEKQDVNNINDKIRLFPDQTKKEYPSDFIIIIDGKSRDKFSFPHVNDNV